MRWVMRLLIAAAIATLAVFIGGMIYVVRAKYQMNEYVLQLGAAFNAATMVNAAETYTDEERAVIASYEGQRSVIVPENYTALQSFLKRSHAMPLFAVVDWSDALQISFCGQSRMHIVGDRDGQGATIRFESAGKKYTMHVAGGDLFGRICTLSLSGSSRTENIILEN